ncbi:2-C-methyl-D-erythritol 4-phosphate cytidylyltransferase [Tindallia californiensis]|uniref:2-C-methyl-D-erythritol 4-phosphate cytidylyltransferase n=1 Tax=Tindallia californiensis TaxID=159292 RepID=A0A1H3RA12_9FIRM|nr:2-C-methyl-D-erythritol 4-phosphate cytidylyltransferase [Tindallia californiensis]SDZ22078.1 2-C-methyl-D-erythritol 4-phosphate cytidylyltransferase [Tindallia californiensis]
MNNQNKIAVIIVAGGGGKRMNSPVPKQFLMVHKKPVLAHSIQPFNESPRVHQMILVVPEKDAEYCRINIVERYQFHKATKIVAGGSERIDSVRKGLEAVEGKVDYIAIHDGARPLIHQEDIERVFDKALETGGAILASRMTDTVKKIKGKGEVVGTLPRSELMLAQTPQIFCAEWLKNAYQRFPKDKEATDDASVLEYAGYSVHTVCGKHVNSKMTTSEDLKFAAYILEQRSGEDENRHRF